jgi:hypothetical protein
VIDIEGVPHPKRVRGQSKTDAQQHLAGRSLILVRGDNRDEHTPAEDV